VGDLVQGKVTKVVTFGAFVEIHPGVEGLVHISELAAHHVENPREVVSQGDELTVRIIEIDGERRRLSLSLKRVSDSEQLGRATGQAGVEYGEGYGPAGEGEEYAEEYDEEGDATAGDEEQAGSAEEAELEAEAPPEPAAEVEFPSEPAIEEDAPIPAEEDSGVAGEEAGEVPAGESAGGDETS
jgi:small subunit ribosomal protein S1